MGEVGGLVQRAEDDAGTVAVVEAGHGLLVGEVPADGVQEDGERVV